MFEKCLLKYGEHSWSKFIHIVDGSLMRNQVCEVVGVDAYAEYLNAHPFDFTDTGFGCCFAIRLTICNKQDELPVFRLDNELFRYPP